MAQEAHTGIGIKMAANMDLDSESMDELLAGLASMGFELEDCHEALQAGYTSLQSAVEWLLGKKTKSATTHSNKEVTPQEDVPASSSGLGTVSSEQEQLKSRYTLSNDARVAKERFIEKEREVAKTEAKRRKLDEKRVREQILMQIADDKQTRKARSLHKVDVTQGNRPSGSLLDQQPTTSTTNTDKSTRESQQCLIKIRQPNGSVKTGAIPISMSLEEAVMTVSHDTSCRRGEIDIIQPFPHKIFTPVELASSLESLGLCPSAMVVIQRKNVQIMQSASNPNDESVAVSPQNLPEPPNNQQDPPDRPLPIPGNGLNNQQDPSDRPLPIPGNGPNNQQDPPDRPLPIPGNGPNNQQDPPDRPLPIPGNYGHDDRQRLDVAFLEHFGRRDQDHQWHGEGMRLGAVEYNPHAINPVLPASSPGESAMRRLEIREQRLHNLSDASSSTSTLQPHLHREVKRLEDISIDDIALRLAGHPKLQPMTTLGTLSHNICDRILDRLMKNKALTPKTMHAFLSCCLRYVKLDCYLLVTNELLSVLRFHKHLTVLSLKSCPLITDKAMESLAVLKKLQSLNINQCSQLTNKCLNYIIDLPLLTVLQMDNTKVTDQGVLYFVSNASCATSLIHLSLCSTAITDLSLEVIKNLKSLKILGLENTKITKLDALLDLTNLERLNVSSTQLTDESLVAIRHHSSLSSLNLLSTNVTDAGLQLLQGLQLSALTLPNRLHITDLGLNYITGFPLTALDIADYINITDVGIHFISTIYSLSRLTLSNTKLTDAGLISLSGLVQLVELNVDRTSVSDYGCSVVQNFQHLQILSFSSTLITNKLLLDGVLNCCPKLNQLNLSRTRVSNKGISCLNHHMLTLLNLDWTRVTSDCQILLTGCPALKALRTNNCTPSTDHSDEEEDQ